MPSNAPRSAIRSPWEALISFFPVIRIGFVVAPRFSLGTFLVPATPPECDAPLELRLVPGSTLAVRLTSGEGAAPDSKLPIQLEWNVTPFEGAQVRARIPELDGGGSAELTLWYTDDARAPLELEIELLPGTYSLEVDLEEVPPGSMEGDPTQVRPLHRCQLEIAADVTCVVDVD